MVDKYQHINQCANTSKKHNATSQKHSAPTDVKPAIATPLKASASDSADMVSIYTSLRTSLSRFAYRYFKTPEEIEDVVQEAFVKVIEARRTRDIQHPKSYMYQTVKNLALNRISKNDYRLTDALGDTCEETVLPITPTLEQQFESRQRFELFCRAVRQLPIKCQRVYILRKVYGYSQKEIASQLDISIKTVEAHLTKAIVRCTDYMDDMDSIDDQPPSVKDSQHKHRGRYHG